MQTKATRSEYFNVRMTKCEKETIKQLSTQHGGNMSKAFRKLILQEAERQKKVQAAEGGFHG